MTQYPMSANGSLLILNDTSTVEEVDLFNNLQNIVVTNADEDVWKQIGKVSLNAHNPNHGEPSDFHHFPRFQNLKNPATPPEADCRDLTSCASDYALESN